MKTARVGLTSIEIDFLKQAYSRDPNPIGLNTLDLMDRCHSPMVSDRMQREINQTFKGPGQLRTCRGARPKRTRTPPPNKRLVGSRYVNENGALDEYSAPIESDRSSIASSIYASNQSARSVLQQSGRLSIGRLSSRKGLGSSRSQTSVRQEDAVASIRESTRATQRSARLKETARLKASKSSIEDELLQISLKLKDALCAPQVDPMCEPALIKSDSMVEGYDPEVGYRCFMRDRYGTQSKTDFGQDHFDRPFTPKGFRQETDMGKYANALAKNRNSLRDVF